jgi:hypothetical protein
MEIFASVKCYFTERSRHFHIKSWPLAVLLIRTCTLAVKHNGLGLNFIPGNRLCWFKVSWLCRVFPDIYCNSIIFLWLTTGHWRFSHTLCLSLVTGRSTFRSHVTHVKQLGFLFSRYSGLGLVKFIFTVSTSMQRINYMYAVCKVVTLL